MNADFPAFRRDLPLDVGGGPALAPPALMTLFLAPAGPWRRIRGWLFMVLLLGGSFLLARTFLFKPSPLPVRVVRVQRGLVEETVSSTKAGSLRSRTSSPISVDTAGTIVALHARQGAKVRKGDRLVSLDARDAEAALAAARRELAVAESMLGEALARRLDAFRERERFRELRKSESASQSQLDEAETRAEMSGAAAQAAEARVEAQKAVVRRAEIAVDKCEVRAPFDGVVAELYVEVGEWAIPGKVALRLLDPDRIYVRAELDEVDLAGVRPGRPARVLLDPYKGRVLPAVVTRVAPYVSELEEQNRTLEIELELRGGVEGLELKPGTSADVEVILSEAADVLRVPSQALLEGDRILLAAPDGRARAVPVKVGIRNWDYAQILEGLSEGAPVIVSLESEGLKDGVRVTVSSP